jgi:hypothetical protein
MRRLIPTLYLLTLTLYATAQTPVVFDRQPDWDRGMDLSENALTFDERGEHPLTFDEAKTQKFVPYVKSPLRYSEKARIVRWIQFSLINTGPDTLHFLLSLNAHYSIKLYGQEGLIAENGISLHNGHADRGSLPFRLDPHATTLLWARIEERVRYLSPLILNLDTPMSFAATAMAGFHLERWLRYVLPIMTGVLFLVMLFGFSQYFLVREKAYLYYGMFAGFALLFALHSGEERFNLALFSREVAWVVDSIIPSGILISYTLFVSHMLDIPIRHPRCWSGLKGLMLVSIGQTILMLWEYASNDFLFNSNFYYGYLTGIPQLLTASILFYCAVNSDSVIRKFIMAGLFFLVVFYFLPICVGYTNFHELPFEIAIFVHYGPFSFLLGLMLEAMCFAFALAYRTKLISDENMRLHRDQTRHLELELARRTEELQRQNRELEAQRIKQLQTEFDQKIAETEMTALRAQMNPHFIFNCLNSIKLYTLENDSVTASEYLTIFSQLIRLVLENSTVEKITLANELEILRLYMAMEAMRFKSKVQYRIDVDEKIDVAYVEIPPLLLQPFVENAIWHGLMHKAEGGFIHIDVKYKSDDLLSIAITDNGIGRTLAQAYKSKSVTRQKSFGMKLTSERINLINQLYQSKTSVQVIDRVDEKNHPCGTQVLVEIPV